MKKGKYTYKRDSSGKLIAYDKDGKKVGEVNDGGVPTPTKRKPTKSTKK